MGKGWEGSARGRSVTLRVGVEGFTGGGFEGLKHTAEAKCIWVGGAGRNCGQPCPSRACVLTLRFWCQGKLQETGETTEWLRFEPQESSSFPKTLCCLPETPTGQIKAPSSTLPQHLGIFLHRTYYNLSINLLFVKYMCLILDNKPCLFFVCLQLHNHARY